VLADPLAGTIPATMEAGQRSADLVVRRSTAYVTGLQSLTIDLAGRSLLKTITLPAAGALTFASGEEL